MAEEHARLLPPVRRDWATTADGDEDLGAAAAQGGEKGNADFDVDEGDSEVAYDVDPERLGEYSLEVSHIVMAQEDECRQWMQDAERQLRGTCGSYVCYFMTRLLLLISFSGFFSMLPVMFKLGNPYDVSKEGVRNNLGYYLAYNGLGWGDEDAGRREKFGTDFATKPGAVVACATSVGVCDPPAGDSAHSVVL